MRIEPKDLINNRYYYPWQYL